MNSRVTLEMIYDEVKSVNERFRLIEDIVIKGIPEVKLNKEKTKKIKRSIKEMKRGNYVTLEELKNA